MIRTYISGEVIEKTKFWVPAGVKVRSGRVKGNTSAAKYDQNYRAAIKAAARTLNCNFGSGDILLTCKYCNEALNQIKQDETVRDRFIRNFLRRLRRALGSSGRDLKAFIVHSSVDGESGRPVRPHVHIVITGTDISFSDGEWIVSQNRTLSDLWGLGSVYGEPLHGGDLTPLALYMLRQARRRDGKPSYTHTRNMATPIIMERICPTSSPLKNPAKTILLESGQYNAETGTHYIRYFKPRVRERTHARLQAEDESVPDPKRSV